jgi:predicted GIY-YIG superfamily endonuclease
MEQIYVLQCEKGKYYVGKTTDVMRRFEEHRSGKGSAWTNKYKPLKLMECKGIVTAHDENNITKDLMKKYGIEHVRGGSYAQVTLSDDVVSVLQRELQSSIDVCYKCNLAGHVAAKCPVTKRVEKKAVIEEFIYCCSYCDRTFTTEYGCGVHERSCRKTVSPKKMVNKKVTGACYRCGRPGHYSPDCYARTDTDGNELSDDEYSD